MKYKFKVKNYKTFFIKYKPKTTTVIIISNIDLLFSGRKIFTNYPILRFYFELLLKKAQHFLILISINLTLTKNLKA